MRTIKFCFVVCGVTSRLSVVNKIHLFVARRCLLIAGDGRRINATTYILLSKCWCYATVRQWPMPKPDVGQKSRFFPQLGGGSLSEYCHNVVTFGTEKTRAVWLPDGEIFFEDMFIRFDRIHQRDRQTEWQTDRQMDTCTYRTTA